MSILFWNFVKKIWAASRFPNLAARNLGLSPRDDVVVTSARVAAAADHF
jgi:hypothetical protein